MKNKIFKILIISYLSFFASGFAMAAENCAWTKAERIITTSGPAMYPITTDTLNCPTGAKTCSTCIGTGQSGYLCCGYTVQAVPLTTPKFTIPDFQIKIPGLTSLSQPTCTTDENGNRSCGISWISEYVFAIYNYGLTIVGVIAVLILMAAGILWIVSGGDSGKITKAKEMIMGSVTGLLLIVSMSLLLSYINPDLVKQKPIALTYIEDTEPVSNEGNPTGSTDCQTCKSISGVLPLRDTGVGKNLDSALADKIAQVAGQYKQGSGIYFVITEAYPPTSQHNSACHKNGKCADIALRPTSGNNKYTCADVTALIDKLTSAGIKVYNEYTDCKGTKTTYATAGHLHIQ